MKKCQPEKPHLQSVNVGARYMEFHRPDIEGFDRKGLVDHVRPSVVKKYLKMLYGLQLQRRVTYCAICWMPISFQFADFPHSKEVYK